MLLISLSLSSLHKHLCLWYLTHLYLTKSLSQAHLINYFEVCPQCMILISSLVSNYDLKEALITLKPWAVGCLLSYQRKVVSIHHLTQHSTITSL